jgi:hypothetical protein
MRFSGKGRLACFIVMSSVMIVIAARVIYGLPHFLMMREAISDPNLQGYTDLPDYLVSWKTPRAAMVDETSLTPETFDFLQRHNGMMAKLAKIGFDADSLWPGYRSEDKVWSLHFELDRLGNTMSVASGDQRCIVKRRTLLMYANEYYGSMHTNLLHLCMFASFDPREFQSVEDRELVREGSDGAKTCTAVKVATSQAGAELCFDKQTGRLVRITFPLLDFGFGQVDMYDYAVVDGMHDLVLPTLVRTKLPDDAFSVGLPVGFGRVIQLRIDPKNFRFEYTEEELRRAGVAS